MENKAQNRLVIGIILGVIIIGIIGLYFISAYEFDNSLNFTKDENSEYGKITIKDWTGFITISELELKENTDNCGSYCSSILEIIMYEDGTLIDNIKFLEEKEGEWKESFIEKYKFLVKTGVKEIIIEDFKNQCNNILIEGSKNNSMKTICNEVKIGEHTEYENIYEEYKIGTEVQKGNYYIRLEGKKNSDKIIDWKITSQGKLINEWAVWGDYPSLTTGLIHYYNFETTNSSAAAVDIIQGANGSAVGIVAEDFMSGKIGNGVRFDGSSYFNFGSTNGWSQGNLDTAKSITFSLWFNVSTSLDNVVPFGFGSTSYATDGWGVWYQYGGGKMGLRDGDTGDMQPGVTETSINDGSFHHFVVVKSPNYNVVYLDGVNMTSGYSAVITNMSSALETVLGAFPTQSQYHNGIIDEAAVWNRSLNSTEIIALYNEGDGLTFSTEEPPSCLFKGTVKDINGNPINLANVTIISQDNGINYNTITNLSGHWNFTIGNVGNYTVIAYNGTVSLGGDIKPHISCTV
jgi:hypothetical protein